MARWSRRWRGRGDGNGCWTRAASLRSESWRKRSGFSLSYVSRILRLTLLAPDIVERILDGCPALRLAELMQPFPVSWERRAQFWGATSTLTGACERCDRLRVQSGKEPSRLKRSHMARYASCWTK